MSGPFSLSAKDLIATASQYRDGVLTCRGTFLARAHVLFIRSAVCADMKGVTVRDLWRIDRYRWDEIAGFDVLHRKAPPLSLLNPARRLPWYIRREVIPVLRLQDGSERLLKLLASAPSSNGWTLGDTSLAEMRVTLLQRFQQHVSELSPTRS